MLWCSTKWCVAVTIVKLALQVFLVPRMSTFLAKIKFSVPFSSTPGPDVIHKVHQTQAMRSCTHRTSYSLLLQTSTAVLFEVVTVLFAPMISVLILDEVWPAVLALLSWPCYYGLVLTPSHCQQACLRYYLSFAPDLHKLLSEWGLGQQGFEVYRYG